MNRRMTLSTLGGFVLGIAAVMLMGFTSAPRLMILEDESRFGFDETLAVVKSAAAEQGWKIPTVHMLHNAVSPYGYDVGRVAVIELCQPHHAARILAEDRSKMVTSMMPCRVAVYETADGRTVVSRMNTGLVAQAFGGQIATVMAEATQENERILGSVVN